MSRSAAYFVLIRDGKASCFAEVWGTLYRELVWGPEAFEAWLTAGEETDWEPEDVSGIAIVDFDSRTLAWGESDVVMSPRGHLLYCRLLENSWPGFSLIDMSISELYRRLDALTDDGDELRDRDDEESGPWEPRPDTVREAIENFRGIDDEDEDEDYDDEDDEDGDDDDDDDFDPPFSEYCKGAWITIIDQDGKLRQRGMSAVSVDLLSGDRSTIDELIALEPVEVPEEKYVTEGLWMDLGNRTIQFWGTEGLSVVHRLRSGWPDWNVALADQGYRQQCQISGLDGKPMSDAEALAEFLPHVLSNKRMTLANVFGAMGGSLKKSAIKATGCLTFVLALPILLVGFFMDQWKAAGYALLTLVIIVVVLFKFVEMKIKSKFNRSGMSARDHDLEEQRPPVAGPLDETTRKKRISQMLVDCGLPTMAEVEPHFANDGIYP
ncbi:MAG: hypothetical protein R3C05_22105 [Pirellulaceae bacterium]